MKNSYVLSAILLSSLVTVIPRLLPFALLKRVQLPEKVLTFLNYLPVSIIFALTFSSLFDVSSDGFPKLLPLETVASLVVIWVAFRYKNLLFTVGVGIVLMALLRLVF